MGFAIATAAIEAGHDVVLISGPVNLEPPNGAQFVSTLTSDEMHDAVHHHAVGCDVLVMCAAVADYKPAKVAPRKIKKDEAVFSLELVRTKDILASFANRARDFLVVGFAAETEDLEENAEKKLRHKDCDMVVANNVSNAKVGMESAENEVTILFRNGEKKKISRAPKRNIARELIKIISNMREKRLTKKM